MLEIYVLKLRVSLLRINEANKLMLNALCLNFMEDLKKILVQMRNSHILNR